MKTKINDAQLRAAAPNMLKALQVAEEILILLQVVLAEEKMFRTAMLLDQPLAQIKAAISEAKHGR